MITQIVIFTVFSIVILFSLLKTFGLFSRRRMLFINIEPTRVTLTSGDGAIVRNHAIKPLNELSNARLQRCIAEVVNEYLKQNKVWLKPHATLCINKGAGKVLTALEVRELQALYIGCVNSRVVDTSTFDNASSQFLPV